MTKNIFLFIFIFFAACKSNKTILQTETTQVSSDFITGLVNDVQFGKDGYTAKVTASTNRVYFITVSRSNLKDPSQYREIKLEERIRFKGDVWKMEDETHVTVRELQGK